jgi:spore germination cell wall hydrolase CwlJ-like protein
MTKTASMTDLGMTETDRDILAKTLYGEARGEPLAGQLAVAMVVFHRAIRPDGQFALDTSVAVACQRAWQFSCWLEGDPNRAKMEALTWDDPTYTAMRHVVDAAEAIFKLGTDLVAGATHYVNPAVAAPSWARGHTPVVTIQHHAFYAGIA